ncbi:MAG TPA: PAS domain S-box protein, partial [Mycobacteriales bacterium]|nr:PAS domain S-box protein [Mycobacteriales bacterium]
MPRVVLDALREGVMVHTADGTVVLVNRAAARLVGADESEIEGRTPYDERWRMVLPDGRPAHPDEQPPMVTLRSGCNVDDVLLGLQHEVTGALRWVRVSTRAIGHGTDERPGAVVVSVDDVTDRRAVEEGLRRSEEQFRLLAEYAVDLITTHGPDGVFRYVSPAVRSMLGYEPDELVGRTPDFLVHPDDEPVLRDVRRRLAAGGTALATFRVRRADGRFVWVELVGHAILGPDGRVVETHSVARDVTARHEAEDRLRASEERYRALVDSLPDAICRFDREGRYLYVSPAAEKITGSSAEAVLGHSPEELGQPRDMCDLLRQHRVRVLENGEPVEFELALPGPNRDTRHLLTRMAPEFGSDGRVERVVTVSRDITGRKRAEEELAHRATHDVLTGLPNRSLLLAHLEHVIAGLNRTPGLVAVLFLDLDRFKLVNDSLGHPAGDHLLVQVARRLAGLVRSDDLVARLGGDEFALALRLPPDAVADAVHIADRVHALLRDPFLLGEQEVRVATSIGIATTALGNTRAASLVRDADAAMYRAKARGRGCTEVFDARLRAEVLARLRLENDLRQAVESDALELRYQPQVDFGSGLVVGVEALVRWPHPEHGLLLPAAFVSLADETGLAADLGRLVLRRGCAEAARWLARWPHRRLAVGVNVSARQIADARFVDDVAHALAAAH